MKPSLNRSLLSLSGGFIIPILLAILTGKLTDLGAPRILMHLVDWPTLPFGGIDPEWGYIRYGKAGIVVFLALVICNVTLWTILTWGWLQYREDKCELKRVVSDSK